MQQILILELEPEVVMASKSFALYLHLKKVCIITFQGTICEQEILQLGDSVHSMIKLVKEIDPNHNIIPKLHHLVKFNYSNVLFQPIL